MLLLPISVALWALLALAGLALGTVLYRRGLPEHALPMKNLGDALRLRNHVIGALEEAAVEPDLALRRQLLTFVVAGEPEGRLKS